MALRRTFLIHSHLIARGVVLFALVFFETRFFSAGLFLFIVVAGHRLKSLESGLFIHSKHRMRNTRGKTKRR